MARLLSELAARAAGGAQEAVKAMRHFLGYCAASPEASALLRASGMALRSHSGAAYLAAPQARPRAGGHTFLGSKSGTSQVRNGPAAAIAKATKHAMASAAEAEVAALLMSARELYPPGRH